jgi:hypothetical protein
LLFQARDQVFVAGRTFGVVRQMLAVLDEVDSTSFSNDEEDVVLQFARRLADDPEESGGEPALLLVRAALAHVAGNECHVGLLSAVKHSGLLNSRMHGCIRHHRLDGCE